MDSSTREGSESGKEDGHCPRGKSKQESVLSRCLGGGERERKCLHTPTERENEVSVSYVMCEWMDRLSSTLRVIQGDLS